jgi:ribosomal protein L40E
MRSGGFLKKGRERETPAVQGRIGELFPPGPIPNPFRVEDALAALDVAPDRCAACGAPLPTAGTQCPVCGIGPPPALADLADGTSGARPETPSRACIHCGAWNWPDAVFCQSCGGQRITSTAAPSHPGPGPRFF